ncbi:unnamed protein product [Brassicogethes aeneus]|uniref:Lipase domain-containing protein n=1 Tax=Brassicogethes aeneus TaxID=1431903 RepID=A0A9P0FGA2_BRAAE|nr:unnamed protein product [Brassicogethes aeneus]
MSRPRSLPMGKEIRTIDELLKSPFSKNKKTKFITHGWMSSGKSDTCLSIKNSYLKIYDVNVFIMDWSNIADHVFYPIPMRATPEVAEYYSLFLNFLIDKIGADPKDLHLIGHSLGAHVSGFAARRVKQAKIGRLTGLDPALPGFGIVSLVSGGSVNISDAEFVDVIHTCMGVLGIETAIGHVDFYPNGGCPPQPGCANILEMIEACSHGRSWQYFANSINISKPFMAYHCSTYEDFVMGRNCYGDSIPMGDPVPLTARGTYYLKTDFH